MTHHHTDVLRGSPSRNVVHLVFSSIYESDFSLHLVAGVFREHPSTLSLPTRPSTRHLSPTASFKAEFGQRRLLSSKSKMQLDS